MQNVLRYLAAAGLGVLCMALLPACQAGLEAADEGAARTPVSTDGRLTPAPGTAGVRVTHGAPAPQRASTLRIEVVAEGLDVPWGLAFLPDGTMLVTERPGRLRRVGTDGAVSDPLEGVPAVFAERQGGLLDVALSPGFEEDRLVYLSYAEAGPDGRAGTALGRGRLEGGRIEGWQVLFRQEPKLSTGHHFGSRIVFDRSGHLFLTLGEANQRSTAQRLDHLQGKIVRLHPDGSIPADNPFVAQADARAEIWSWGHRNPQGAALHPGTGALWASEHGPRGGDEVNIVQPGLNYGWPLATFGINYSGQPIPEAQGTHVPDTELPVYYFERSPGLSGMAFYTAERFEAWRGSLFLGGLATRDLIRLELDGEQVVSEERLLGERDSRIRDVRQGLDGYLYVLDESRGQILRLGLED